MKLWLKNNRGFIIFLLCFGFFRTAIADWNPIPSGSMRPTLFEGDVVLVNRLAYDFKLPLTNVVLAHLGEPQRGDIVTLSSPADGKRLIKRIVALPGDQVEMRNERLIVNGQAAEYDGIETLTESLGTNGSHPAVRVTETLGSTQHRIQLIEGAAAHSSFGPVTVPAGQFLVLGDNRDNSADSRYIGFIPRDKLIGRAHHILASADILDHWAPRFARFGQRLQ